MTHSSDLPNPSGGGSARHEVIQPALQQGLLELVLERGNMQAAWKRVKSNKGAPGIDGMTVEAFPAYAQLHWATIREQILAGRYQPQPVRRVMIPKADGGERPLGIPTVVDRVIQQAIAQILTMMFDPHFSEASYGYRPGRSAHGALRQVQGYLKAGYRTAVDLDLAKFFDSVQHDVLMVRVARRVTDRRVLALIGRYLRAGIMDHGLVQPSVIGTPQGGPLSPLLANILLDDLDQELSKRGHRFVRYADDLMILVRSPRAGERVMASVRRYLTGTLKLKVNEAKSRVVPSNEAQYLGFTFRGAKLRWCDRAFADFQHRVRDLTGRSWGVSMEYRLKKLGEYVRGWFGYYGISEYFRPIPELDQWIRRRIRMCYWKQWRYMRTKIGHLISLGVSIEMAIKTGVSNKSWWRMSKTPAIQQALSNAWLAASGLVSVHDCWIKAQNFR